ncbi:efflux RND transporter periplasmic adaptor subunit [Gemmobacter lutimaris]|nr:efflux RND transporter periplasmic adaptor subunit [Gemmobacter lutimaris]
MAGLPVAMAMPAPGPVRQEITGSGYVVAPNETTVFSRTEGRIIAVPVQTGDRVAAGQVLITLADAAAGFGLEQAQAGRTAAELALAAREIELKQAEAALARQTALAASQAVARAQVDEARSRRDLAANAVLMARQAVDEAALAVRIAAERVADLTIRAPIAGTVTRLNAHVGDTVLARAEGVRAGDSLATITDTTRMVIDADVAETGIAGLRPGLRGEATLDGYPDQPFKVEILRIAPVISAEKGTVSLRMSLTGPPAGIRPAMAARLRIFTGTEGAGE